MIVHHVLPVSYNAIENHLLVQLSLRFYINISPENLSVYITTSHNFAKFFNHEAVFRNFNSFSASSKSARFMKAIIFYLLIYNKFRYAVFSFRR